MSDKSAIEWTGNERPILFSGPMVNAILSGRKTMTRRAVNPQDSVEECDREVIHLHSKTCGGYCDYACGPLSCPYGQPGDRLWVRETWRVGALNEPDAPRDIRPGKVYYSADGRPDPSRGAGKVRQSIFMPRWASRITLEITDVRVERLQDISEDDALSEGIEHSTLNDPRVEFQWLWDSINAKRCPWASNPWVWVVSFNRTNQHADD